MLGGGYAKIFSVLEKKCGGGGYAKIFYGCEKKFGGGGGVVMQKYFLHLRKNGGGWGFFLNILWTLKNGGGLGQNICYLALVEELPDSLWMNCKSEFGVIFMRCYPRTCYFFLKKGNESSLIKMRSNIKYSVIQLSTFEMLVLCTLFII